MIVRDEKLPVETAGMTVARTFQIKPSRKAFEILSSGLYSDKVRAVIRELSTNAADAHVAAGKPDVQFEVHLPNHFEPYFAVKDYGTGLSEKAIYELYTTYFASDKTDSNEFTGALGLGSKSPFCYTDSFTVTSRHNGVLLVFNCHLNADGIPDEVQPDACLWVDEPGGPRLNDRHYLEGAPQLVVEIAASSASYDLHEKKEAYRRNGVYEYVVWRVLDRAIDWFELRDRVYVLREPDANGIVESARFAGLRLHVPSMLAGDAAGVLAALGDEPR